MLAEQDPGIRKVIPPGSPAGHFQSLLLADLATVDVCANMDFARKSRSCINLFIDKINSRGTGDLRLSRQAKMVVIPPFARNKTLDIADWVQ